MASIPNLIKSRRIWLSLILIAGLVLLSRSPLLVTPVVLIATALIYPRILRPLRNVRFWLVILLLVLVIPAFTGTADSSFLGIRYSHLRLSQALLMSLRGIIVFLLFQILTLDRDWKQLSIHASRLGFLHLDAVLELAHELLPRIKSLVQSRWRMFREQWRPPRKYSPRPLLNFLQTTTLDLIQLADHAGRQHPPGINPQASAGLLDLPTSSDPPNLIIVIGDQHSGKTTWLETQVEQLRQSGQTVDGILSRKHSDDKYGWHHAAHRISTDENRPLNTMDPIDTNLMAGKFYFYPASLDWACQQLLLAQAAQWLIIDEIGHLEWNGQGFLSALVQIVPTFTGNLVLSLRSELAAGLNEFINGHAHALAGLTRHTIQILPAPASDQAL